MMRAFDATVAVFVRGLGNLKGILNKAEAHAVDTQTLLGARLADDMYDLATQVHWASYGLKLAFERLFGREGAPQIDAPRTFAELQTAIDSAIAWLQALDAAALEAALDREVTMPHRGGTKTYRGDRFLTEFAIPNFFFHLTTAYGILRHHGVPLKKGDFMGA